MTTTLPISNESMARAILRRTLREAPEQQRRALDQAWTRYAPTRQRRGPVFRAGVTYMDSRWEPSLSLVSLSHELSPTRFH